MPLFHKKILSGGANSVDSDQLIQKQPDQSLCFLHGQFVKKVKIKHLKTVSVHCLVLEADRFTLNTRHAGYTFQQASF